MCYVLQFVVQMVIYTSYSPLATVCHKPQRGMLSCFNKPLYHVESTLFHIQYFK